MAAHNDGAASRAFFAATGGLLGDVTVLIGDEMQDYARDMPEGAP